MTYASGGAAGPYDAQPAPGQWVCPFCRYAGPLRLEEQVSTPGWIVFAVLLFTCLPLFWVPLIFMKEQVRKCGGCGVKV